MCGRLLSKLRSGLPGSYRETEPLRKSSLLPLPALPMQGRLTYRRDQGADAIKMRRASRAAVTGAEAGNGSHSSRTSRNSPRQSALLSSRKEPCPPQLAFRANKQVIDVPMKLSGFCSRQPHVPRDTRRDTASGATDIDVVAGRRQMLAQRADLEPQTTQQPDMQQVSASGCLRTLLHRAFLCGATMTQRLRDSSEISPAGIEAKSSALPVSIASTRWELALSAVFQYKHES